MGRCGLTARRAACAAAVLAVAAYANTLGYGFAYDDPRVITDNPAIRDPADWRRIFTTPSWFMDGTSSIAFRPLTTWTFAASYAVHGLAPWGYHAVNVALHAGVSALVVLVAAASGASTVVAGLAGLLFAVHPVHTEVVANGVGRAELLAAALVLLAFWLRRTGARSARPTAAAAGSVAAYGLALLAKEHAVGFLLVLPLADLLVDDDRDLRRFGRALRGARGAYYAALLLVTALAVLLRTVAIGSPIGTLDAGSRFAPSYNVVAFAPTSERLLTVLAVQAHALWLLVCPMRLAADYSYPQVTLVTGMADPRAWVGLTVAAGLAMGLIVAWRRSALAGVCLVMALGPWAVVSNFFVPVGTIFGERFLYLPSAGFCILLAMGVAAAERVVPRRVVGAALVALLVVWTARTVIRNGVWASDSTLAPATVADAPRSAHARHSLATVYVDLGRDDDALAQLDEATRLLAAHPDWPERLDMLYDAAAIHGRRGQQATATALYEEIVARAPDYFPAWINLGALRNHAGDPAGALEAADRAIALRPEVPNAYLVRGHALRALHRPGEAVSAFTAALERAPGAIDALMGLGAAAYEAGDYAAAVRAFRQVVAAAPSPDAYRGLVIGLDAQGQAEEARRAAALAAARYPDDPVFRREQASR